MLEYSGYFFGVIWVRGRPYLCGVLLLADCCGSDVTWMRVVI